jgi:uncharacterized protein YqeY
MFSFIFYLFPSLLTMSLFDQISKDLIAAIKARDELRVSCLRMLKSGLKNRQIEKRGDLSDEEIQSFISSLIRKGQEAVKEFKKGGRQDIVAKEEAEINILFSYLPEQLHPDEIERILQEIISELSAESIKDLGKVMKVSMARMAGRAQGKEVNEIAKRLLS